MNKLFTATRYGSISANNRFVMAPMSRNRASLDGLATSLMATYYGQRASAGLIISEGIQPNQVGQGFMNSPGLYSNIQAKSWLPVTNAVHQGGGKIVAQLMHAGRIGHPDLYASAHDSIAPSAIEAQGQTYTPKGLKSYPVPKVMTLTDIKSTINDFAKSAKYAIDGGFDGVEIHAGNGFLLHQFMATNTNNRTDNYGGSINNRIRFTVEVINAVCRAIGTEKVGVRISPDNNYNDIVESDSIDLYQALLAAIPKKLAYLHIMEAANREHSQLIRQKWQGALILNPHQTWEDGPVTPKIADEVLNQELCDGVGFGALFVANPDLINRVKQNGPYNDADPETFYGGDEKGYTDYPSLSDTTKIKGRQQLASLV